jgi:dUTP pyrophosphatase
MFISHALTIKLIDSSLPVPAYQTPGSAAFDVYSRVDISIEPWKPTIIPLNLVVAVPDGHFLMLCARSSTAKRYGLMLANGIGVIDQDYCGEKDEIGLSVLNFTGATVEIKKGDRVGQAILIPISTVHDFKSVSKMSEKSRGGWGSTGK